MRRAARGFLLVTAVLVAAACGGAGDDEQGATPARVADLTSVDELGAAFEEAAGRPRLVLVLSPT